MDSHLLQSSSPTLTNPDMILPYEENEIPKSNDQWSDTLNEMNLSITPAPRPLSLMIPRTPVFYVNRTLLSDISEVTEVEGTPSGIDSASTDKGFLGKLPTYLSSQSGPVDEIERLSTQEKLDKQPQQPASIQTKKAASSTAEFVEAFKNVRDDVSVDDSVFQGDDEGSDTTTDDEVGFPASRRFVLGNHKPKYNENTSVALSKRAEEILLKAKKRLHNMEGNFNRARNSINSQRDSSVYSSLSNRSFSRSTPSPIQKNALKDESLVVGVSRVKQLDAPFESDSEFPKECAKYSDILSYKINSARLIRPGETGLRYYGGSKSNSSAPSSEDMQDDWKTSPHSLAYSIETPPSVTLEKVDKHVDYFKPEDNHFSNKQAFEEICNRNEETRASSRSTSSIKMTEMQSQMEDLRGRLSALRERTRDEVLRRRSQQSPRTPSPITAAEKTRFAEKYFYEKSPLNIESETDSRNIKNLDLGKIESKTEEPKSSSPRQNLRIQKNLTKNIEHDVSSHSEVDEEDAGDTETDFENNYIDGLSGIEENKCSFERGTWPDEDATISHENREDAFDYQHLFLHSELGTISRKSHYTLGSDDSGETTRGSPTENTMRFRWGLTDIRSESSGAFSSTTSFATASESFDEKDDNEDSGTEYFAVRNLGSSVPEVGLPNEREHHIHRDKGQVYQKQNIIKSPISKNNHPIRDRWLSSNKSSGSVGSFKQTNNIIQYSLTTDMSKRLQSKAIFGIYEACLPNPGSSSEDSDHSTKPTQTDREFVKLPDLSPLDMLSKDDEIHLSRLLDSLAESVLSLKESKMGYDAHAWRKRIITARKVLDGLENDACH